MTESLLIPDTDREYGAKVAAVEPGGVEQIPLAERHGRPIQLLWTWTSPNLEFATVFVGVLGVLAFGLSFWQAVGAIVLGNVLGALFLGILSSWGPGSGLCQMVLSRRGFGFLGNILPAGLNSLAAGLGWFAVNSVSGALALAALTGMNGYLCLVIVVALMLGIAYFGHNLIQLFERFAFPVLAVIFVIGAVVILTKTAPSAPSEPIPGAFWIALATTFGYAAGWNPYASDYTRYLPPAAGKAAGWYAAVGLFVSCTLLETVGAAAVTAVGVPNWGENPVDSYTGLLPSWLGNLTLLAICIGAIAANALNVYSSALSFTAIGIRLRTHWTRALVAVGMGLGGFVIAAFGLNNIASYENFLLVIAYWIGPWLGVVLADRLLAPHKVGVLFFVDVKYRNGAGPVAMLLAAVVSIWLFSNQVVYTGVVPAAFPGVGDLTFEVGFLLAAGLYAALRPALDRSRPSELVDAAALSG